MTIKKDAIKLNKAFQPDTVIMGKKEQIEFNSPRCPYGGNASVCYLYPASFNNFLEDEPRINFINYFAMATASSNFTERGFEAPLLPTVTP